MLLVASDDDHVTCDLKFVELPTNNYQILVNASTFASVSHCIVTWLEKLHNVVCNENICIIFIGFTTGKTKCAALILILIDFFRFFINKFCSNLEQL